MIQSWTFQPSILQVLYINGYLVSGFRVTNHGSGWGFPIDRPAGDAWKYHDAWSHLWRTDHQARCGRDFFEKKGGRSWKNRVDIQTPTKWPAVIVVEITVHESIISHIPILRCPKKSEEYLLRRIYLNIGIKTKPTNATHRNRQTLRWGYDPNLYDYRGDMPEVMTDAKLGHVQEMLESIPYLDCCERQQRSFGLFFLLAKWWGFYLFVGKGAISSGVGGAVDLCLSTFDTVLCQKRSRSKLPRNLSVEF